MAEITNSNSGNNPKTRIFRTFDRRETAPKATGDTTSSVKTVRFNPQNRRPNNRFQQQKDTNPQNGQSNFNNRTSQQPFNRDQSSSNFKPKHSRPEGAQGGSRRFGSKRPEPAPNYSDVANELPELHVPPIAPGVLRIIPICGVEWITTNMTAIEYGDDIIIIDDGAGFKTPDTPGIQCTIPDPTYLIQNKHKIKGIVITHGHLDHVNAIPYNIEALGLPPIYSREFAAQMILKRMEEFPHIPALTVNIVDRDTQYITLSENFKVKFFGLTHSIPDSTGVIIQTPYGGIVSTGDVRVESKDGVPVPEEFEQYKHFKDENILLATIDSTGIPKPGWSASEIAVRKSIDEMIGNVSGRLFIAAYSSQVERLISFIESARKYGRMVVIDGRSMKTNLEIAKFLGLVTFENIITMDEAEKHAQNKLLYLVTGGQGEKYSVLDRVSRGQHRFIKITPQDTIILSSSVVPGNDFSVDKLKNGLYATGARILTYADNVVHASGHGNREELKWIHSQIPYKYFMPVHGAPWFLHMHANLVQEMGVAKENIIIPSNGTIIEISEGGNKMEVLKEKAITGNYIVDGSYVGPVHQVVLDDRITLSENGMFVVVATIDSRTRQLIKTPDIVSRGFVYLRESRELLSRVRVLIKKTCEAYLATHREIDTDQFKKHLADKVFKYLLMKTQKEPIVIPVIVVI
jgi:ribonuclease J